MVSNHNFLVQKCFDGLQKRGFSNDQRYIDRLNYELDVIKEGDLANFFLNTAYIVLKMKSKDIITGLGRGCLSSDSLIYTNKGFKKIKDIKKNEKVLSNDGKFHSVISQQKYPNQDTLLKIKTQYDIFNGLKLTKDHKVLSCGPNYTNKYLRAMKNNWSDLSKVKKFNDIIESPQWVEARHLKKDDLLVLPKQTLSNNPDIIDLTQYTDLWMDIDDENIIEYTVRNFNGGQYKIDIQCEPILEHQKNKVNQRKIKKYLTLDYDFGYFLGAFSGDGWLRKDSRNQIGLCCNINEDTEDYIPNIIKNLGEISYNRRQYSNLVQYIFSSRLIVNLLKDLVPDYNYTSHSKELYGYLLSDNENYLRGLIDGIIKSDGHIENNKVRITTSSEKLAQQVRYVLFKLNVPNSILKEEKKENRTEFIGSRGIYYNIQFNLQVYQQLPYRAHFKEDDDNIYVRIVDIKEVDVEDYVYDLHIEDSHNFLAQSYIVHNSAAGSLVSYCLKITEIDPIKHNLLFERFLNPTRVKMISSADIDVDIPRDKRQEVLKMVKQDFGEDKAFQIINKLQWTEKTAIKDLCRIIDIPFAVSNRITKLIPDDEHAINIPEVKQFLDKNPFVKDNYLKLVGMPKTYGVHAGGVIITDKPIEYYDSIVKVNGIECLDNNGKTADSMGLLKADLLGLNTLTIIDNCLQLLPNVSLPTEYDDSAVFKTINESTLGIFQLEAAGATDVCQKIKPVDFNELCLAVSMCRPGSIDSGETDRYIARKNGLEPVTYDHPNLVPILKDNLGSIVYQEDVIKIVTDFAKMDTIDGETIRKGIGKKIQAIFDEYHPKFIQACIKQDIDEETAQIVWQKMEASASYSFNKAHCVSYTALSYICGWLKTYYPIEFYLAILNNTDDEDKRIKVYNELKFIGKDICNPDINISKDITSVGMDGKVYLSFNLIKEVGPAAIEALLENQPFSSFEDFMNRKTSKINKRTVKALIEAGAMDRFGYPRDFLYHKVDNDPETPYEHWEEKEILFREFNRIKINPNGNVLNLYDLKEMNIDKEITSIRSVLDNKGDYNDFYIKVLSSNFKRKDDYAFASVTDGFDSMSIFIPKEFISRYIDDLNEVGNPLLIHLTGKDGKYTILSLLNLHTPDKHKREWQFYNGESTQILKALQKNNADVNVGLIDGVKYFVSKKGNPCVYYNCRVNDEIYLEQRIACGSPPLMVEGSFIFFLLGNNETFLDIVNVV